MVRKLKEPPSKDPLRMAACSNCGWLLAVRTAAGLMACGWRRTTHVAPAFFCATCVANHPEMVRSSDDNWEASQGILEQFPKAPKNAFPRAGGKGPMHENKSRPA